MIKKFKSFAVMSLFFIFASLCCTKAFSEPAPMTLDSNRQQLYSAISVPYLLDGDSCHPFRADWAFPGGMKKVVGSTDPFVSKLAHKAVERVAGHSAMYDTASKVQNGAGLEALPLLKDFIQGNFQDAAQNWVNAPFVVKNTLAAAIRQETTAQYMDDMRGAYEEILSDSKLHARGASIDPKAFALDFLARGQGGQSVVRVVLHNGTGRVLHNSLVVAIVKHDPAKVNAQQNSHAGLAGLLRALANAGDDFEQAQAALKKANEHFANTDRAFEVFIPEWRVGQTVEVNLAAGFEVNLLLPGELSIISDEVSSIAISLQPEKMSDALKHILPLNASEDLLQLRERDKVSQRESVRITKGDGEITYRFLAYPEFWSEEVTAIIAPQDMKNLTVVWEPGTDIKISVNGYIVDDATQAKAIVNGHIIDDATQINCRPGDKLGFRTEGNEPVAIAVRFLQREPTEAEKDHLDLTPTAAEVKKAQAERTALREALIAVLQAPSYEGVRERRELAREPASAHLVWDAKLQMVTGWINFPSFGNKKAIEGRIIDNLIDPPFLELVETRILESRGGATVGAVYMLHLSDDGKSLLGPFTFHKGQGPSGTVTLTPSPSTRN